MNDTVTTTSQKGSPSFRQMIWKRLSHDRIAMTGVGVVAVLLLVAYLAPVIANDKPLILRWQNRTYFPAVAELVPLRYVSSYPELRAVDYDELEENHEAMMIRTVIPYSPYQTNLSVKLQAPSAAHLMGTDSLGRDVMSRIIHGAGVSLKVGLVAVGISLLIGVLMGALAGFYGGRIDMVISRFIEVVMCFPSLFLILAVIAFLPPSIYNIMIVIGLTRWTGIARYTRGEFMRIRVMDFTDAARALGASDSKIIVRHILPNSLAPVLVAATFGIANAILIEAALSFLGMGVQPPHASWGGILANAQDVLDFAWWLAVFPGLAIFLTVTAYNIIGEGLRDASDPRLTMSDGR